MQYQIESDIQLYIDRIKSGEILVGKYVKQAIERYQDDLLHGSERGICFNPKAAQHVIDFFKYLRHSKGKWAGKPIVLELWQKFILAMIFGWKNANGKRRFRTAYIEVAKKNGKSTLAAGIGLYLMVADNEAGAEIFSAATKRDQAKITHDEAINMVRQSPALSKRISIQRDKLFIPNTATKFIPLGKDSKTMDGLNVHGAIVDELHAHPDSSVWGNLITATAAREQPLIFAITTAGENLESFCHEFRTYIEQILNKDADDDSTFGIIFSLDDDDDWTDDTVWIKANPNLGVTVDIDSLRDFAERAKHVQTEQNNFKTKHLNLWVTSLHGWVDSATWLSLGIDVDEKTLVGRPCYAGLDLSSTLDITALVYVFPPQKQGELPIILPRAWIPEGKLKRTNRKDYVPYEKWAQQGYINIIPGDVIDYSYIYKTIEEDSKKFKIKEIGYDRRGIQSVYNEVNKMGVTMIEVGQGFMGISNATKETERLIVGKLINHNKNPVLYWNMRNVMIDTDAAGNVKPNKAKSRDKIDLVVALIMAVDRYFSAGLRESVYAKRGLITF